MRRTFGVGAGTLPFIILLGCGADPASSRSPSDGLVAAGGDGAIGGAAGFGGGFAGSVTSSAGGSTVAPGNGGSSSAGGSGTGGAGSGGALGAGGALGMGGALGAGGTPGAGGSGAGGSTVCDWSEPPADVAAWVEESWNDQLGSNIRNRQAWNLDHVMLNGGSLNLCMRWGATSPVPESVRTSVAATTERWFNDWFKGLGAYGCFPYGDGIRVKVTGWAVRPGQEGLLGGIDPAVPVYTETDREGEPKCPDACSSFVHWDHDFSNCPGGDANHTDYWLWFDDALPGGGGAAAVGGDWGLRMPVSTFVGAFDRVSFGIVEHEMGHGFGFQDYYDWTGSRPNGGSLMIVRSSSGQSPTTGDIWLLRRTWKEMKALRGW